MLRFSANISTLFTDRPFLDRFAAAAHAGFSHVECQFPYDASVEETGDAMRAAGVAMVLHNLPAGDWAAGQRGLACLPSSVDAFRQGVNKAIVYAHALGVHQLNCLAGIPESGVSEELSRQTLIDNLKYAASALQAHGLHLLVEPINTKDVPGFMLSTTTDALAILDAVGADNVFLQYDLYHAQRMEGDLVNTMSRLLPRIGHMQIADNPGRAEPGTGEMRFQFLFDWIEASAYAGYVGCEYFPADKGTNGTERGLGWLGAHGREATGARPK